MRACFRFYAELNNHLPGELQSRDIGYEFPAPVAVEVCLQTFRVPSSEVDLILANGVSAPLSYLVEDLDRISVYPVFESMDISTLLKIRARPLRHLQFVLSGELEPLAAKLRRMGFDCLCAPTASPGELIRIQRTERRVLLTRDPAIIASNNVERGYRVRASDPRRQVLEVLRRFDLYGRF
ncbi:MAG: Mut7-C RNAse domain-containing protein [Bryobacteraceae bacterium]